MAKGHLEVNKLEKMKVEELKNLAKELKVSEEGKKAELIERIAAVEVEIPEEKEKTAGDGTEEQQDEKKNETEEKKNEQAAGSVPDSDTKKVKVVETYRDLQAKQTFSAGFEFETSKERARELVEAGVAELVE